jgi:class 3 adenylate cyclase/TolB-like protein
MARDQRRLAAIVSADVAGYSRLMGLDESRTLAALKAHRRELIDPKIAEYGGRIVKTTGDGLLLEFPSVVEAVRCAVDVQRGLAARNADVQADEKIEFRIGINVGDIIIDGDDIYGDGVNVAARLEALAEPGQICVSKVVRDQVLDKLNFGFEELGAQQVKNIARPVEVYQIRDDGSAPARPSIVVKSRRTRILRWAIAAVAVGVLGIVAWQLPRWMQTTPAAPAFSVAVMPFTAATGSQDEVQFANALTQNVVTLLGKDKLLGIASPRKVLSYKDNGADARTLGRELNVRYLVDGEVRAGENKVALTLRLVDAQSGTQVWSDRLETDAGNSAVGATAFRGTRLLVDSLYDRETQRAINHPVAGSAADLYLQGRALHRVADSMDKIDAAYKYYNDALRVDPDFLPASQAMAELLDYSLSEDLDSDRSTFAKRIDELDKVTAHAVLVDDGDATSWYERAGALGWLGRWDQALTANAKARSLASPVAGADTGELAEQAFILLNLDRPEEALAIAQHATETTARKGTGNEGYAHRLVCWATLLLGRYQDSVAACERSAANDSWWVDQAWLAAGYAQLGESAKSAAAKTALLAAKPGFTIEKYKESLPPGTPDYRQRVETHLYAGLLKAGLPEK